jgi:beta-glucosidase
MTQALASPNPFMKSAFSILAAVLVIGGFTVPSFADFTPPSATQTDPKIEARVDNLLKQMTLAEKVTLLKGTDYMHTGGVPRLGIPSLKFSDGPMGTRCWGPSTAYPAGAMLASTWDSQLALEEGRAIGRDARSRGVHVVLGPGVNIYREAQNGRNFEYFGEDPFLASQIVTGYVSGVQSQGVAVSVKHYVANGQETDRGSVDTIVSRRALEEIYFPPFKAAIQQGNAWTVMAAYNKVNGDWCTANKFLLTDVLRGEWGYQGVVMSDWGACHDTEKDLNAGTDLEMDLDGGHFYKMENIQPLLQAGKVTEATIDEHVRRILRMEIAMGFLDRDQTDASIPANDPQNAAVAMKVASEGIVLLKNEGGLLPLDRAKVKHIVVAGPNGQNAVVCGGGSGEVQPFEKFSVLQGIQQAAGTGVQVDYIPDLSTYIFSHAVFDASADTGNQPGMSAEYFTNPNLQGTPLVKRLDPQIDFGWGNDSPMPGIEGQSAFSARWTGTITPKESGDYVFAMASDDGSRAFLDDKSIIDMWTPHALMRKEAQVHLDAGHTHHLRIEYFNRSEGAQMYFGWAKPGLPEGEKDEIAKADAVIYAGGLNPQTEHEGSDRDWDMPPSQVAELKQLLELNPRVITTVNAGGNLGLGDNLAKIPALLWCWYPGQNGNVALGKILFGDINPSGHLPDTFEKRFEDSPAYGNYPGDLANGGKVNLAEGIYVGYRWFDKKKIEPQFPFGFGLSYTTFTMKNLQENTDSAGWNFSVSVTNTGKRAGSEVVQLYVRPVDSKEDRPFQELKAFARVDLQPGETREVQLNAGRHPLAIFDETTNKWIEPKGKYEFAVGDSSRNILAKFESTF